VVGCLRYAKKGTTIDSSNEYPETPLGGEAAREKAENTARNYIANILRPITAKYLIIDTFKIPGRGIVFAGYITEGSVLIGDIIEFSAFHTLRHRPVTGIEGIAHSQANKINTGLLIKCNSEEEIEELRNWNPEKTRAIIYKR
jgi:translation elongation factor EF-Tu-like GTPase